MAVAVSVKAAAAPSQSMASGKCHAAAAPCLLSAQEIALLWALSWPQWRVNKDPVFLLILTPAERKQHYCLCCSLSHCPAPVTGISVDSNIIALGTGDQGEKQPKKLRRSFLHIRKFATSSAPELLWNKENIRCSFPPSPSSCFVFSHSGKEVREDDQLRDAFLEAWFQTFCCLHSTHSPSDLQGHFQRAFPSIYYELSR